MGKLSWILKKFVLLHCVLHFYILLTAANFSDSGMIRLKVKYIGEDKVGIRTGKIYEVISIEKDWYRIMTELDEDYLFPPELFEIVEE